MKVLKYGGSSVGNAERINQVIKILNSYLSNGEEIAVVFSAFQGVTDKLIEIGNLALTRNDSFYEEITSLKERHINTIAELNPTYDQSELVAKVEELISELREVSKGVYLLKELTPRTLDFIVSFGERLSCTIISGTMSLRGIDTEFLDSRLIIKTDSNFGNARVNFEKTFANIKTHFAEHKATQIITGFISSTENNETTTLGRGGSDYTASIYGAALEAEEIHIWTDVDGILTADPRKVEEAFPLKAVTYEEAMELSHFGAKVIYPPTMAPALKKKIKIRIKNTFNPDFKGTVILPREKAVKFSVKGISSIDNVSLLRIQGGGMVGVTGIASRIFGVLAKNNVNIILITQASSEHSICMAVSPHQGEVAKAALDKEFHYEIAEGQIGNVILDDNRSVIAVVGEDLRETPGVSGKVFRALGNNGINIHAIAQGSSELNISLVIERTCLSKALKVLHDALFISSHKTVNLFMVGPGLVGQDLLRQINEKADYIAEKTQNNLKLIALANSKKMSFNSNGINPVQWKDTLESSDTESDMNRFIEKMKELNLPNSIFVDCTASSLLVPRYSEILGANISVVTPNKIANSSEYARFKDMEETAKAKNVQFRYGTNVGAALPIIQSLRDLVDNGDEIVKIEGVLSGTLSYLFNEFKSGKEKFSEILKKAKESGFTEPDPRDDLSGLDVARKLLILTRVAGMPMEMEQLNVENLVPKNLIENVSVDEFMNRVSEMDDVLENKKAKASDKNSVLCYIAKYEGGKADVQLMEIDERHPFYGLKGNDNIVAFTTKHYSDKPLVIQGAGAGAAITASGILLDILRISNYLG